MSEESTKTIGEAEEPSDESLAEMPELGGPRFRRRPDRGHHVGRSVGSIVSIDDDVWQHFGNAKAVNDALRRIVEQST